MSGLAFMEDTKKIGESYYLLIPSRIKKILGIEKGDLLQVMINKPEVKDE